MKYPFDAFREDVIKKLSSLGYDNLRIEEPKEEIADLALPCFQLSRTLKMPPDKIAEEVASKLEAGGWIEKIEATRGYVNFFIDKNRLADETIKLILSLKDSYGKLDDKNKKVIVEHTSANPNGPLHVGRARNPIIGDTMARILKFGGYDVITQYYVDDMGRQVATLFWGVKNLDIEVEESKADHRYVVFYQEASKLMEKDERVREEINDIIKRCEEGDRELLQEIKKIYKPVLEGIMESLNRLHIYMDEFVEESRFVLDGSVYEIIEKLASLPYAGEEGKAIYLDLEEFGIHGRNKKFFLTRSNGTSLYAARDIAYHIWKGNRADIMINILGEDHKLEAEQVRIALKLLNEKIPDVIFYSFVSLPEGRMSTRKGRVVYLDELIDEAISRAREELVKRGREENEKIYTEIGIDAIRYNIIKVNPDKAITFRWEDALSMEGESAPFIQYAHARCSSILRKADFHPLNHYDFTHQSEIKLIRTLAKFPDYITRSINSRNPAIIADYAYRVASDFNIFYRDCKVIGDDKEKERLALVMATKQVLKNALSLLGMGALEEM